jgi:hypothetical protein
MPRGLQQQANCLLTKLNINGSGFCRLAQHTTCSPDTSISAELCSLGKSKRTSAPAQNSIPLVLCVNSALVHRPQPANP